MCAAGRGQVQRPDDHGENDEVDRDFGQTQQIEQGRAAGLPRRSAQVEDQRPQQVGGERPDMEGVQQDHEPAGDGRMEHPEHRRDEAEEKVHRLGDGRQRGRDRQRQDGRRRLLPALLPGCEDKGRRDAEVAEGLGKA